MPGGVENDVFAALARTKEDIKIASDESLEGYPIPNGLLAAGGIIRF